MSWDTPTVKVSNRLQSFLAVVCAFLLLVPPLNARNKEGDKFYKLGLKAESQANYDAALSYYDKALNADSQDAQYLIADQRLHAKVSEMHLAQARKLISEQKLDEALAEFQKAFLANPGSAIAMQGLRDTSDLLRQKARQAAGTPVLTAAERARQELERRINSLEGPPTLRPINGEISSIKMNNQPARVLYETIGKLAGINVLLDPQGIDTVQGKNFNLDLNSVTLEEALNYVSLETHTFWKAIRRNAIFVTQESDPRLQ